MLDPRLEPTSDLEWLLHGNQSSREMLADALVHEQYAPAWRLAYALLGDVQAAREAVVRAFSEVLSSSFRYRGRDGALPWVYGYVLKSIRSRLGVRRPPPPPPNVPQITALYASVDALGGRERLALLLYYLLDWETGDAASLLKVQESALFTQIELFRQRFIPLLYPEMPDIPVGVLDGRVSEMLGARWPAPSLNAEEHNALVTAVLSSGKRRTSRQQRRIRLLELGMVAVIMLCAVVIGWAVNTWFPLDTGLPPTPTARILTNLAPASEQDIVYVVHPGDTLASIAQILDVPLEQIVLLNPRLAAEDLLPGEVLRVGLPASALAQAAPASSPAPLDADVLDIHTDGWLIQQRMRQSSSLWQTAWVEAQGVDYGPASYIGPPRLWRWQAWLDKGPLDTSAGLMEGAQVEPAAAPTAAPDAAQPVSLHMPRSLELSGPLEQPAQGISLALGGNRYAAQSDTQQVVVQPLDVQPGGWIADSALRLMLLPGLAPWSQPDTLLVPVRFESLAQRRVLVADWYGSAQVPQARLWLDALTGVTLRLQTFSPDGSVLLSDAVITSIVYDKEFPQTALFSPQDLPALLAGGYARGYDGELPATAEALEPPPLAFNRVQRPRLDPQAPPQGFDPALSTLRFQFLSDAELRTVPTTTVGVPYDLFGDGFLLGRTAFDLPWGLRCARSPDGQRLAYLLSAEDVAEGGLLRWFHLSEVERIYQVLPSLAVTEFAFSPDNRSLAAYGYSPNGEMLNGIYLVDIPTGEYQFLFETLDPWGLTWNPNGASLAWIQPSPAGGEQAIALHVKSSLVLYQAPYQRGQLLYDWPMRDWGVPFPLEMGGLDACAHGGMTDH